MGQEEFQEKVRKSIGDFLKDHDMYGHSVTLNFDKKGDTHNTFFGGFFSIWVKIAIFIYVALNVKKLVLSEGDELGSEEFLLAHEESDSDEVPEIDYRDS